MSSELPVGVSPHSAEFLRSRAVDCFQRQQWQEALAYFEQVLKREPRNAQIHNYRARVLESLNRHEEALDCLNLALEIDPSNIADLRNRAIVQARLGHLADALSDYNAALRLRPNDASLLAKRGLILNQSDRREEALADANLAVSLSPKDPDLLNTRVIVLDNLGRYWEAFDDIDRMLSLAPNHLDAINNSGMIFARLGRFEEALRCYNQSLALKADQPQALYNRSLVQLSLSDWIRGFQEFESRWAAPPLDKARISGLGPRWQGGDQELFGKTLLLYHEQGYGDSLQCVRYIPLLAARGAKVLLAVPPALESLMKTVPGVNRVLSAGEAFPEHDYQSPLMSLMQAFRTTADTVPTPIPYLSADPARVADWDSQLGTRAKRRIGIAWSGRRYAPINYPRDIALAALRPLFELDAEFVSLQQDVADSDRETLNGLRALRQVGERLRDFADTAALIETLDLVIAVDSAVAHLAGAMGKPVWLLNRRAACWRWLQEGSDCVWYPTLRQFRQTTVGNWTPVVIEVRDQLEKFLAEPRLSGPEPALSRRSPPVTKVRQKIRFVTATRLSKADFFRSTPLGRSLPSYRQFPKHQVIEVRVFADNAAGLPTVYNTAIEESQADPAILVFIHDDVYMSDYFWAEHVHKALEHFDLVGLAGNRRRVPRQASWMYLDDAFTRDNYDNLSGVLGHGNPFPDLRQLSVYGEPGQEVKLLDGVMLAVRSELLIERDLKFDPQFQFHFYDMDFCRQAELRKVRMGTWGISVVHASAGKLGVDSWRAAYRDYLKKYGET